MILLEQDETLLEIATDKVDSEVPSPASGILVEILAEVNDTIEVGNVIAIIETDAAQQPMQAVPLLRMPLMKHPSRLMSPPKRRRRKADETTVDEAPDAVQGDTPAPTRRQRRTILLAPGAFHRHKGGKKGVSMEELESIEGSGAQGRVNKQDVLDFIEKKKSGKPASAPKLSKPVDPAPAASASSGAASASASLRRQSYFSR